MENLLVWKQPIVLWLNVNGCRRTTQKSNCGGGKKLSISAFWLWSIDLLKCALNYSHLQVSTSLHQSKSFHVSVIWASPVQRLAKNVWAAPSEGRKMWRSQFGLQGKHILLFPSPVVPSASFTCILRNKTSWALLHLLQQTRNSSLTTLKRTECRQSLKCT